METYIILTRISPMAMKDPSDFKKVAEEVKKQIKKDCPDISWKESYAVNGRFDVVDIVESDHLEQVQKAAMIIRSKGHSSTETLIARPWDEFLASL